MPSRPLAADYVYIDNIRASTEIDVESALHSRAEGGKDLNIDTIIPGNSATGLMIGNADANLDSEAESLTSADHNTAALLMALEKGPSNMNSVLASNISGVGNNKTTTSENSSGSSGGGGGGGMGWLRGVWGNSAVNAKERDK